MAPLKRLLVANRGEIAVRIARGAHSLGMEAVGVFSEVDRGALHTTVMDVTVALGGSSAAESYLRGGTVIEAALRTGCDSVHPGYGFLAENAEFARSVIAAGLVWVGPTPEQIELLGDKVAAKRAAVDAGVPTTEAVVVEPDADTAGLPVPAMVKAAAGGGGRGMRVVTERGDFAEVIAAASREAQAAFGDGTVFVEPLIESGRHIEVQILGDHHGNVVHLGERDCSIQRRHQKVIEEAPAPGLDSDIRQRLCDGAVALARSVGYAGAGTVEYLVGADDTIAFLEVNTRLQVEHPVTEAVWGVDLVALQLQVAAGEPLPFTQRDLSPFGHAIEARLVAEDPSTGWMPTGGTIERLSIGGDGSHDALGEGIRVDTGVGPGSSVSSEYDSLLAKVIAHGDTRAIALGRLGRVLRSAAVFGVVTNADTLAAICGEPDFADGAVSTAYLDGHPQVAESVGPTGDDRVSQMLAAVFATERSNRAVDSLWGFAPSGWRNVATQGQRRTLLDARGVDGRGVDGRAVGDGRAADETAESDDLELGSSVELEYMVEHEVRDVPTPDGVGRTIRASVMVGEPPQADGHGVLGTDERRVVIVEATSCRLTGQEPAGPAASGYDTVLRVEVCFGGVAARHTVACRGDGTIDVSSAAGRSSWRAISPFTDSEGVESQTAPVSPLPGAVVSVHVSAGDNVDDGDLLVVIEAMKMEHRIEARGSHTVDSVAVNPGDKVDAGTVLVTYREVT
ncbi:MAG: biotin carboxylase N-terminal domain-containing protein [Microthrixaceae bacterium]